MRTTWIIIVAALMLVVVHPAAAQFPYGGGYGTSRVGNYGGAYGGYRGIGGSLSPYLNLTNRGVGSAATNYYNFVRPGMPNPASMAPFAGGPSYLNRGPLFPQSQEPDEDRRPPIPGDRTDSAQQQGLPPTGHPTYVNETFGFFGPQSSTPGLGLGGRNAPAARLGRPR